MAFLETPRFPEHALIGASGGPKWQTRILQMANGFEHRNAQWQYPLHQYTLPYLKQKAEMITDLLAFFHAMQGPRYGFRVKDWADFNSAAGNDFVSSLDQVIGTGDGTTKSFQLIKTYQKGTFSTQRLIQKPVIDSVKVALDGIEQPSNWSINTTTGLVTFNTAPAQGITITTGFEFDVPCRFMSDALELQFISKDILAINQLQLTEIRL